jgi:hypothetical protein
MNVRVTTPVIADAEVRPTLLVPLGLKNGMTDGMFAEMGIPVSPVTPLRVSWIRLDDGGSITTNCAPVGAVVEMNVPEPNVSDVTPMDGKVETMFSGPSTTVPPWNVIELD